MLRHLLWYTESQYNFYEDYFNSISVLIYYAPVGLQI